MAQHLTIEQIEQYRRGNVSPAMLLEIDDHIASCDKCRAALRDNVMRDNVSDALSVWASGLGRLAAEPAPVVTMPAAAKRFEIPRWSYAIAAGLVVAAGLAWQFGRGPGEPQLTAVLNDAGGKIGLNSAGTLVSPVVMSDSDKAALVAVLKGGALKVAAVPADLIAAPGTLLGPTTEAEFGVVAPLSVISLTDQPQFKWQPSKGALTYEVSIFDAEFREVDSSGRIRETSWTPVRPLARGALYQWQVTAYGRGREIRAPQPPAPEAKFRILDAETASRIAAARASNSHLLAAMLSARAGMHEEAKSSLDALQRANPQSDLAVKLAESLR